MVVEPQEERNDHLVLKQEKTYKRKKKKKKKKKEYTHFMYEEYKQEKNRVYITPSYLGIETQPSCK